MNATIATRTYAKVATESGALVADPHKLISMLYQGALLAIANAKNGMMRNDVPAKGAAITKAIDIIGEGLLASLDKNVGGELAHNLAALYEYMNVRLLTAHLNNDITILDEVTRLLSDLKDAWDSIRPEVIGTSPSIHSPADTHSLADLSISQPRAMNKVQRAYGKV
jgi:flagellar protein FliS